MDQYEKFIQKLKLQNELIKNDSLNEKNIIT